MFRFTDDCLIGIKQLDDEHRKLFDLLNKAEGILTDNYSSDRYQDVKDIIEELANYAEQHFAHEEAHMKEIRDPELIRQRTQHDYFREKIRDYEFVNIENSDEQCRVLTELVNFLVKWLYRHILGSDILIGKLPSLEEWMVCENPCEFTDDYLTGIELVDCEHRELFRIVEDANRLVKSYNEATGYDKILDILDLLKNYTKDHFADEEEYMTSIGYDGLEAQKRAHDAFIQKLENIDLSEIDKSPQESLQQLLEFLLGWLVNHILYTDKKIPVR